MDYPVVTTKLGKVKGSVVELHDETKVKVFRNIPFAKPPTDERRFMPPEPADGWSGTLDGTKPGNMPMYMTSYEDAMDKIFPPPKNLEGFPDIHDEDCLHLTVYVPANKQSKKMAVMVWFYGGGFQTGSERLYDGTVLAGMNDVVVVMPNYRVGIMGFFNLGPNSPCSGNSGLLDQQQALRWVQEHIEEFGGDRNNVTIFGQSAGAASVHMQILSPTAKGLFHKAICHSGQKHLVEMFEKNDHMTRVNQVLLKHLGIESDNDNDILKAMQKIPGQKLVEASAALVGEMVFFSPIVDGKVLPKTTGDLLSDKNFAKVPCIFGCNNTEGDGILAVMSPAGNFAQGFTEDQAKMSMMIPMTDEGHALVRKRYLRDEDGELKYSKFLGRVTQDASFVSPVVESSIAHREAGADVYCYVGGFQLKMHHDDAYGDVQKKPDWCECDHGDDIFIVLGGPFSPYEFALNAKFSEDEKKLSKVFMTYLTNFAKTGNPNEGRAVTLQWPKYTPGGKNLLVKSPMSVEKNLDVDVMKFWRREMTQHMKSEW